MLHVDEPCQIASGNVTSKHLMESMDPGQEELMGQDSGMLKICI
jgi:hypothetical protein